MSKNKVAISIKNVTKEFKLPHEKHTTVKSKLINSVTGSTGHTVQKALKNVSFDIHEGEFFGIVGRNGSGKSTLLKCIAGVYSPTRGHIQVNGSLVPFIELGVGFNPELTGRDNVFLNGALLGFSEKEVGALYPEIVEFAELEEFMDQKLKNYSSGMQVRLAFSIAIRAKGEILLLDEVLAVGDEAFQKKCYSYFDELKANNRTVILVSHSMANIEEFCDRAALIDRGKVVDIGDANKIAGEYSMLNIDSSSEKNVTFDDTYFIKENGVEYSIYNKNRPSKETRVFEQEDTAVIDVSWRSKKIKNIGIALIKDSGEYIYGPNTIYDNIEIGDSNNVSLELDLNLMSGRYHYMIAFFGKDKYDRLHLIDKSLGISIGSKDLGWSGLVKLDSKWRIR